MTIAVADDIVLPQRWQDAVRGTNRIVGLADGEDIRAIRAAHRLHLQTTITPRLVGRTKPIRDAAERAGIPLFDDLILDTDELAGDEKIREVLKDRLEGRRWRIAAALLDPVSLAAAALRIGDLHGCVAGATRPTADVLRAGLRVVGLTPGLRTLSSAFLMVLADGRTL